MRPQIFTVDSGMFKEHLLIKKTKKIKFKVV